MHKMNNIEVKGDKLEADQEIGKKKLEANHTGKAEAGLPPPPYRPPEQHTEEGSAHPQPCIPPGPTLPISIPLSRLASSFRARFSSRQRRMSVGYKPSDLIPMKVPPNPENVFDEAGTSEPDSTTHDSEMEAMEREMKLKKE